MTADQVKECGRSQQDYDRIMKPISEQREREDMAAFNEGLRALPARGIPTDRYEIVSQETLKKEKCCMFAYTDAIEAPKHPLFGKRLAVQGLIRYFPTDHKDKIDEHQWIELEDSSTEKFTWQLEADLESLSREERAFIRAHCDFDECLGKFYGVIGRLITTRGLEILGLQIEYVELTPMEMKKKPS